MKHLLLNHVDFDHQTEAGAVQAIIKTIRLHLQMEVVFLTEFLGENRIYRYVDSDCTIKTLQSGILENIDTAYYQQLINTHTPELIEDAEHTNPILLPEHSHLRIGSYLNVPIHLPDGSLFGSLCCLSRAPVPSLNERDLALLQTFAEQAAKALQRIRRLQSIKQITLDNINQIIDGKSMYVVYQPIFNLIDQKISGFEALSRFSTSPSDTPDIWFREAHKIGMGIPLEVRAIELAIYHIKYFQDEIYVSVNISPQTATSALFAQIFNQTTELARIVLEITEHDVINQYEEIAKALEPYRTLGLKLAVDDAGSGYASFGHILNLHPDYIKLDISLTHNIDTDPARRALAAALVNFSRDTGCDLIAEGVETSAELATLIELGIQKAQGFFLGQPLRLQDIPAHLLKSHQSDINQT